MYRRTYSEDPMISPTKVQSPLNVLTWKPLPSSIWCGENSWSSTGQRVMATAIYDFMWTCSVNILAKLSDKFRLVKSDQFFIIAIVENMCILGLKCWNLDIHRAGFFPLANISLIVTFAKRKSSSVNMKIPKETFFKWIFMIYFILNEDWPFLTAFYWILLSFGHT